MVDLEDDVGGGGEADDLARHEAQLLVVVQHRVDILDPHAVHWTVQNNPLSRAHEKS